MRDLQRSLFEDTDQHPGRLPRPESIHQQLRAFRWKGKDTAVGETSVALDGGGKVAVETFVNEFWTSRQRAAHSLHEISYRACFKPQLPRFFIERLTTAGDTVYDPFMGRGTTPLEAALLGRMPIGCDINPLSAILLAPRLSPTHVPEIARRLHEVDWRVSDESRDDLLVFYHPDTLREVGALKRSLLERERAGLFDDVDRWIRMVAVNRLTGHSPGFFSVYTLPPNQAVSVVAQRKINADRDQIPPRRDVPGLIVAKSRSLLADCNEDTGRTLREAAESSLLLTRGAAATPEIRPGSVALVVTSPPFLDVVDYAGDNWLRCWFCGIDPTNVPLTILRKLEDWQSAMTDAFTELARVLKPGGHIAFEVGEVRGGQLRLEEHVIPCGLAAGLEPLLVLINAQKFTKTANCWGVANNTKGTNSNRVVLFRKPARSLS
jgi:hypothetical protein